METWCFLGILFSLPHNKADVYVCAASKVIFGHPKWPLKKKILYLYLRCPELLSKVNFRLPMARNAIESEFRISRMCAGGHFVKKKIDFKWPEMRSKVNFGHTKWPTTVILSTKFKKKVAYRSEMRSKVNFGHPKCCASDLNNVRTDCWPTTT